MEYTGREHSSTLQWDEPPTLTAVEKMLQAHIGQLISDISNLDV